MPTSNFRTIPHVIAAARELGPASILDVGLGFGKFGFLLREYIDVAKGRDGQPHDTPEQWHTRIDGVEIFPSYIRELQKLIYNDIYVGDIRQLVDRLPEYDLILLCDVIEHFQKEDGLRLLGELTSRARSALLITTPAGRYVQGAIFGNPAEEHRSEWRRADFSGFGRVSSLVHEGVLIVGISRKGQAITLNPRIPWTERIRRRLRALGMGNPDRTSARCRPFPARA